MTKTLPTVLSSQITLLNPSLKDNRAIEKKIRNYFRENFSINVEIPLTILKKIPTSIKYNNNTIQIYTILVFNKNSWYIADINKEPIKPYGLAIDLGSTSIVYALYSFIDEDISCYYTSYNPQIKYGNDILSRIIFASTQNGLHEINRITITHINETIEKICNISRINKDQIYYLTIAGNTTMMHLLLGLDPSNICREPYIPAFNSITPFLARDIGISVNPYATIYVFPNVGSYFGGDLLAGILETEIHKSDEISLLVDVGTNAEVVLGNKEWLVCTAGAAGPALEGGILKCGMMASEGAIDHFYLENDTIRYSTIKNTQPKGICGSGAIDLLACLFKKRIVNERGEFQPKSSNKLELIDNELSYVIHEETHKKVFLSQSDIKNLLRSKAAMYTILTVLVENVGIEFKDIQRFYVAGAFGSYIDPKSAITIGMLPDIPLDRFHVVGNSSLKGAIKILKDHSLINEVEEIRDRITYIEMNVQTDFMSKLTAAMFLPHTDKSLFPSVTGF